MSFSMKNISLHGIQNSNNKTTYMFGTEGCVRKPFVCTGNIKPNVKTQTGTLNKNRASTIGNLQGHRNPVFSLRNKTTCERGCLYNPSGTNSNKTNQFFKIERSHNNRFASRQKLQSCQAFGSSFPNAAPISAGKKKSILCVHRIENKISSKPCLRTDYNTETSVMWLRNMH